ncbi:DUF1489 family protein [Rhodobaculum claviforme]|uniref:Lysophospholipase n=1 Tax=Rhodobaculum claviforme TaxID=1549854 RepID=A0A934TJK9_9RHOB|nr:DUF1489 domain-containing protein [Rhodobaculum claviforme]MBK5926706.1 lysophospholipase [Rhodobaculum claviforme]
MADTVHIVKLCVGADGVDDLSRWQARPEAKGPDGRPWHVTRMWPRRAAEVLAGGSLYWVFRGVILARQRIVRLEELRGGDGVLRCGLVLDPAIVRTEAAPRRPFQGWRYLDPADAPRDLAAGAEAVALPPELAAALADLGVR